MTLFYSSATGTCLKGFHLRENSFNEILWPSVQYCYWCTPACSSESALSASALCGKVNPTWRRFELNNGISSTADLALSVTSVCPCSFVIKSLYLAKMKHSARCGSLYVAHNRPARYSTRNDSGNRKARWLLCNFMFVILKWPSYHL